MTHQSSKSEAREHLAGVFNETRRKILDTDRRFSSRDGHLVFDGADLHALAYKHRTPFYVFSERELIRNMEEIKAAFKSHPNTRIFYASKACSVLRLLKIVKEAGLSVEANSPYEILKCLEAGFSGDEIVLNGVLKKKDQLELAVKNHLYLIVVDSMWELKDLIEVAESLRIVANIAIRVEPSVPSPTQDVNVAAYNVKAGVDLKDAEIMCRTALASPWINLRGLHLHVGDQVPVAGPFALAVERVVDEAMRIEKSLGIEFELIDIGGGIPTKYKYETGNAELDNFYGGITPDDFAQAVLGKIEAWRPGIQICTEPGRKVVGSASALLTFIGAEKTKTVHDLDFNVVDRVHWMFVDAGYSLLADSLHFKWFYTVLNASRADDECDRWVKLAGPLCDGGDYYHQGIDGEFFPVPKATAPGDVVVFLDTGAYSIESQTTYNGYPRTAVYLINKKGEAELIRREDSYEDLIRNEKCCEG